MRFNRSNIISYTLMSLSLIIIFGTLYFVMNIKVLEGWKISLPQGEVHVGDSIVVQSTYTKLRSVSGESVRYIECKNKSGVWVRYELNRATSDRAKGKGGTGIVLTIRRDIADVPTRCKVSIAIRYDVLPFRSVNVYNSTNEFDLLPERANEQPVSEPTATTQSNPSQVQPSTQVSNSSSSPQTTPETTVVQPETSHNQPEPQKDGITIKLPLLPAIHIGSPL